MKIDEALARARSWVDAPRLRPEPMTAKVVATTLAQHIDATAATVTREELLRGMDAYGASPFVIDERTVDFLNYFLKERGIATHWRQGNQPLNQQQDTQ